MKQRVGGGRGRRGRGREGEGEGGRGREGVEVTKALLEYHHS